MFESTTVSAGSTSTTGPGETDGNAADRRTLLTAGGPDAAALAIYSVPGALPRIGWVGPNHADIDAAEVHAALGILGAATSVHTSSGRSLPLLTEVSQDWFGQPGLRGHRGDGTDWSTAFVLTSWQEHPDRLQLESADALRGLMLRTELEAVAGGLLRIRHTVVNTAEAPYLLDGLDVMIPVPDRVGQILDLTGRWGRERTPQRHPVVDGVFLREGRTGKTGPESVTTLIVGTESFEFRHGEVWAVHLAWSGNSRHFLERLPSGQTVLGAGELLLPGEIVLGAGEHYTSPWVYVAASAAGLDGLAAQFHRYLRSLPAHPSGPQPVTCNVWEAVYFNHDLARLTDLADQAASIGIERFVLDDGWFSSRRSDHSGLGDWQVSAEAWPDGLSPLVDRVRSHGMQFGLWFEPEMVNADSDLFRAHPEWLLAVPGRSPREFRNQLVLDLGRPEVLEYLFEQVHAVLSEYPIDYVKWDHNRSLGDGADQRGAPGVHRQTLGFYALLDRLRAAHPSVQWESCASGGARIDLGVLQRAERVWTSDMTDALSRQLIQRWTGQLVAPEYLGAHVSAPANHQTGRELSLDFRAGTAFFGSFGVEWDINQADAAERDRLATWIQLYKRFRTLLHSGRTVRVDTTDPAFWIHGVIADDRSAGVLAYVQLDEAVREPVPFLIPGLKPDRAYRCSAISPEPEAGAGDPAPAWPGEGLVLRGAVLAQIGLPPPQRRPQSVLVVHAQELD